ncbi:hypothetical protein FBY35_0933 [Streptomyces sp. SLBN-118]|uniref:hypothetical protein n=1 Tax=Streptomyces sp. SLBN-118 TaxID=2768454 RepID=UPI0011687134|nr:hypothetical protein [Streptomyces sp. SLBN-118]TQK50596.1 hypothetical protein FBY35_0933 [Streptomyces sp. SLBN-118]
MQPESTNGTSGGGLAVPMAWLCAEYIADEMLRAGALVEGGSLEYRAGRQTLALTIYLCDSADELAGVRVVSRIDEWLSLTSYDHPWQEWVHERLTARQERERDLDEGADPDLALALDAWRWLRQTELLAADLGDSEPWHPAAAQSGVVDEYAEVWTPAWQLGLPLSHLAIHLFC